MGPRAESGAGRSRITRAARRSDPDVAYPVVGAFATLGVPNAPNLPLGLLRQLAENDPDPYVRNEASSVLVAKR